MADQKTVAISFESCLPDFVVSLGHRRSQQVAEG
jgi:hypothetical protein